MEFRDVSHHTSEIGQIGSRTWGPSAPGLLPFFLAAEMSYSRHHHGVSLSSIRLTADILAAKYLR